MVTNVKERQGTGAVVEEELKKIKQTQLTDMAGGIGRALTAAGIMQLIFGVVAIAASGLVGTLFEMVLSVALMAGGAVQIVGAVARNNGGRFVLGVITVLAGALAAAHPIFALAFMGVLIGLYLVASGIARFFGAGRPALTRIGGIIGVILGIVVLAQAGTASAALIGIFVGVSLLIDGIISLSAGSNLRKVAV